MAAPVLSASAAIVVTGASTGIGRALCAHLLASRAAVHVVGVARNTAALASLSSDARWVPITADVAAADAPAAIAAAIFARSLKVAAVVQNAGVIGPIAKAVDIDRKGWEETFATNVTGPLMLISALQPLLLPGCRVLHIGSGAAHNPVEGWAAYCASKAAFHMLYQVLREELKPRGVLVGSVRPGIVDTPMQAVIRGADADAMPARGRFQSLHAKRVELDASSGAGTAPAAAATAGAAPAAADSATAATAAGAGGAAAGAPPPTDALDTVENVSKFLSFLLFDTGDEEFAAAEWDIRQPVHHARWATTTAAGAAAGGGKTA